MKAVILAGGYGTRISEESGVRPKPMVEIGGQPILWHILKMYSQHGINDFIICCGYKGYVIKEFFSNYMLHKSDVTFNLAHNTMAIHNSDSEPWKVTLIDTGDNVMTGGRIRRVKEYIGNEPFCLTYGDGVSDVDITKLVEFHRHQNATVTLTAVKQPGRFGAFQLGDEQNKINDFTEKPTNEGAGGAWINGGFFVVEPEAIDQIAGDSTVWEKEPLEHFAANEKLAAFRHRGFWHPMDTLRDKNVLEELWQNNKAPWKSW
ncbi:glucose-1-phosphate cytidylyltransferase [Persicobacter psychrovividus]|uniref:Glucose-1-phosphate cytidylyltransferase n=1 Tax=Persicobacter psychrovividus TaxID=387638 RepID=A0ABM7VKM7_9BACT|nr:glucose-1-phosphate cytidylyltransferase [Persicobacter psychrovividus]